MLVGFSFSKLKTVLQNRRGRFLAWIIDEVCISTNNFGVICLEEKHLVITEARQHTWLVRSGRSLLEPINTCTAWMSYKAYLVLDMAAMKGYERRCKGFATSCCCRYAYRSEILDYPSTKVSPPSAQTASSFSFKFTTEQLVKF